MNLDWFDQLPDWRDEFPRHRTPPMPLPPQHFSGAQKFDAVTLNPVAEVRLARSLATLKTIEGIVMKFPTFPNPPMEQRMVDQSLEAIQALLSYALEPVLTDDDLKHWDLLVQAIAQSEGA